MALVQKFDDGFLTPKQCINDDFADEWGKTDNWGCWYLAQFQHPDYFWNPISVDVHYNGDWYVVSKTDYNGASRGHSSGFDSRNDAIAYFKQLLKEERVCPNCGANLNYDEKAVEAHKC